MTRKLKYVGTGTVQIEGVGEVSHGDVIELAEATARALLKEQPGNWSAQTPGKGAATHGKGSRKS